MKPGESLLLRYWTTTSVPMPKARRPPLASTIKKPTVDLSSSEHHAKHPNSSSIVSEHGGASKEELVIQIPNISSFLLIAAVATGVVAEFGESVFKKDFATTIGSRSLYVTTRRGHQNGIQLNTPFSTRSAKIGKGNRSKVMSEYSSLSAPPQLKPVSKCELC